MRPVAIAGSLEGTSSHDVSEDNHHGQSSRRRRLSHCLPPTDELLPQPPQQFDAQRRSGMHLSPSTSLSTVIEGSKRSAEGSAPLSQLRSGWTEITAFSELSANPSEQDLNQIGAQRNVGDRQRHVERMAPLRRDQQSFDGEDVLFAPHRTSSSSLLSSPPLHSHPPNDATPVEEFRHEPAVDQLDPPSERKTTLRSRILTITTILRARRIAGGGPAGKANCGQSGAKISWRTKALAITNMIRLGRVTNSESQAEKNLDRFETSGTENSGSLSKKRGRRNKACSISTQVGDRTAMPLVKAFENNRELLDLVARQDLEGEGRFPAMKALKVLLSSDKTTKELMELSYDARKLQHDIKVLLQKHEKEEKKRLAMEEADDKERRGRESKTPHARRISMGTDGEDALRRKEIGYQMPKETFERLVDTQDTISANQMVVARLMQLLIDLNKAEGSKRWNIPLLRMYTCLDPDSWFINAWTVVYMILILHITTVGLYNIAFDEDGLSSSTGQTDKVAECNRSFSAIQWFDAVVDLFFLVDILCRLLLFGQIVENKSTVHAQSKMHVVVDPQEVLRNYVRNSLAVDLVTAIPIQWIAMLLEAACYTEDSAALLLARTLRVVRITRVVKLFRTFKVRMWMRKLKRMSGNTSIMQMLHLVVGLAFLNHVWTCLSWLIQSLDDEGFEVFKAELGLKTTSSSAEQYSIMFMNTLQIIFAIEAYRGDTMLEAWFGSLTLALSVFISATMLSKILEIWQMANETQTQRDSRINTVMQFTARNGISTDLRNEVLDYFEFRYSNPAADFEKRFLDDLPSEMQARVIAQMFPGALEKSALLAGSSEMFISQLIVRMARRPLPTMPQQVILAQGAFGSEMFLLKSGTVQVSTADEEGQSTHFKTLGPGSTFGDLSMWMDSRNHATVTSLEFCQLHMLTRHDLEETLQSFPENSTVIAAQALAHCLRSPLCRALEGISVSAAERIGRRMAHNRVEFEPGFALYVEGEEANGAYVIRKGKVEVELLEGRLEGLDDVRCVGFDAMLLCSPYQETVRAKEMVVAYRITADDVIELFARDQDLLEERERTAEVHYKRVTAHNLDLRWMLMSQELLARSEQDSFFPTPLMNPSSRVSSSHRDETDLSDQLTTFLNGGVTADRDRPPSQTPSRTGSGPVYSRPACQ